MQEHYQKKFFDIIAKRNASKSSSILHDVMDILNVRKGAAYKRMNGDTAMTLGLI